MKDIKSGYSNNKTSIKFLLLLFVVNYISHFRYFKKFGFYEDDFSNIAVNYSQNLDNIIQFVISRSTSWIQGHPLLFVTGILTYIGDKIGGLNGLYILSFIIVFINCYLVYRILKKIFPGSELFAVTGSLCFCLFPSDTTKIMLTHTYFLQISLMFFFTATLLYLKGWVKTSYFVIVLCILSYESPFLVFFGIPLLKGEWNKKFRNEMIRHVSVLSVIIVITFIVRKFMGEERVAEVSNDALGTLYKVITSLFIGPGMNFFLFLRTPVVTIIDWIKLYNPFWSDNIIVISIFCLIIFIWYFYKLKSDKSAVLNNEFNIIINENILEDEISDRNFTYNYFKRLKQIFLASLILLILSYAVSFTHYPPTALIGRMTSVHLAATFAGSIIFACLCASIMYIADRNKFRKITITVISIYLTLLVGYQIRIQIDFAKSWEFQKSYWTKILELSPDINENTVIILPMPMSQYRYTRYVNSFSPWSDRNMLLYLFKFPKEWKNHPMYNTPWGNWKDNLEENNGTWKLNMPFFPPSVLQDSNVILIVTNENNDLVRIDSSVTVKGKKLNLKPKSEPTINNFEKTPIYDLMIRPR